MKKSFILILCGAILVAIDQLTKRLAMTGLAGGPRVIIDGVFELRYTENRGAAFGMLQNQRIFFIILTFLALLALIWLYFRIPDDHLKAETANVNGRYISLPFSSKLTLSSL